MLNVRGSDLNVQDNTGATLLHAAVAQKSCSPVAWLVWQGADLNLSNKKGQTPWELAHESTGPVPPQPDDRHQYLVKIAQVFTS
jgi:hypothetical protein